ncbi:SDR family NAD(P)-dependent oxidoreductase [Undibacterium sp. Ji49W]|uniref:SDR family NAD(P)-dependent oxidoreductase n=1 Tax=Undibacterium sp. Ji49W TaxID=3413040 RepID=UPI003BF047BE
MKELNNTVVFVTGANRGLGLAFATALLEAGVKKVYAAARNPVQVASQVVDAIVQGQEEVCADDITRQVKQGLSLEAAPYLREGGR